MTHGEVRRATPADVSEIVAMVRELAEYEKARALPDLADDEWREFVCVEVANIGADAVALDPGDHHITVLRVSVRRPD